MARKTPAFPKQIYIKWGNLGEKDEYLAAGEFVEELLEKDEGVTTLACYQLIETCEAWLGPEVSKIRKVKP